MAPEPLASLIVAQGMTRVQRGRRGERELRDKEMDGGSDPMMRMDCTNI